jgi:hypothetical protein
MYEMHSLYMYLDKHYRTFMYEKKQEKVYLEVAPESNWFCGGIEQV